MRAISAVSPGRKFAVYPEHPSDSPAGRARTMSRSGQFGKWSSGWKAVDNMTATTDLKAERKAPVSPTAKTIQISFDRLPKFEIVEDRFPID